MDPDIYILTLGMEMAWTLGRTRNEAAVLNYPSLLACNTASNPGHSSPSPNLTSLSMHGTLLLACHSSYGPTINGRLLVDRTIYTCWLKIDSGMDHG